MSSPSSLRIFLVDDDEFHNELLKTHLSRTLKVQLETFSTGESAIEALKHKPHIVILDYFLNSKNPSAANGIQVLKTIKRMLPETKVVMLSGNDKLEIATECIRNGAYDYIVKNETSNIRTENAIVNLDRKIYNQNQVKKARSLVIIMVIVFILIVIGAIIYSIVSNSDVA